MRILPSDESQARKEKILQAVVHLYIRTGKPVGSSTIGDNYRLNLSPATIRNVLADLEKEGFLTHPHTSAGRIPTDRGYRFYVDSIVNIQRLAAEEEQRIRTEYTKRRRELEDLMLSTTRVLSALSHCTGFVLPHKEIVEKLRRVDLIPFNREQVLAVLVSESGFVRNHVMNVGTAPDQDALRKASNFLNDRLAGLEFPEAQTRLTSELMRFEHEMRDEQALLTTLGKDLFGLGAPQDQDLYVEGASNIFNFPEFQDYEAMRTFAHLVDEKEALGQVLARELSQKGLQVRIGAEMPELKDFSVVSTGYSLNGRPVGIIGILGPKRMEYERMMSIVNTVANLMSGYFEGRGGLIEEKERP